MQRMLKDSGTSFRQVLDDVRNEHARGYLASTAFSDGEVSFLLGFEDPNSFCSRNRERRSPSHSRRVYRAARSRAALRAASLSGGAEGLIRLPADLQFLFANPTDRGGIEQRVAQRLVGLKGLDERRDMGAGARPMRGRLVELPCSPV